MHRPELPIPPSASAILLVDNSAIQPHTEGNYMKFGNRTQRLYQDLDTLHPSLLERLAEVVTQVGGYRVVHTYPERLRNDSLYLQEQPIDSLWMSRVFNEESYDLVLIHSLARVTSTVEVGRYAVGDAYASSCKGEYLTKFDLYEGSTGRSLATRVDVLPIGHSWIDSNYERALYEVTPQRNLSALIEAKVERLAPMLLPSTQRASRIVLKGSDLNMHDAYRYVLRNQWQEAAIIWEYLLQNSSNTKTLLALCLNLALWYEFEGEIDKSLIMVDKALSFVGKKVSGELFNYLQNYRKELVSISAESVLTPLQSVR